MRIIAGKYRHRELKSPKGSATRPTSSRLREALFNIIQQQITGAHFIDLFAGSGAMGIEALSRGAAHTTFVDNHKLAIQCIRDNLSAVGAAQQTTLLPLAITQALPLLIQHPADIIYIDPPYHLMIEQQPAALYLLNWFGSYPALNDNGMLFIEQSAHIKGIANTFGTLTLQQQRRYGSSSLYLFAAD